MDGRQHRGVIEIDCEGALALVLVQELASLSRDDLLVPASLIAIQRFDFDDVGAAICEELAAIWRRNEPAKFDHAQPLKRPGHGQPPFSPRVL